MQIYIISVGNETAQIVHHQEMQEPDFLLSQ